MRELSVFEWAKADLFSTFASVEHRIGSIILVIENIYCECI